MAALDGDVQLAQLDPKRIEKSDVQELLLKVEVRPDSRFTALYPDQLASRVTVRLKSGESFSHEVSDYPGSANRPFTWKQIEAKFDKLAAGHADEKVRQEIKRTVQFVGKYPSQRPNELARPGQLKLDWENSDYPGSDMLLGQR